MLSVKICLMNGKKTVYTCKAPEPLGHYSQGIQAGDFVFCSGQIAIIPETGSLTRGDAKKQTRQILKNLKAVLSSVELELSSVVKTDIFLADIADFEAVNEVYSEEFGEGPFPARCTVEVSRLPKNALVEISVIAYKGEK